MHDRSSVKQSVESDSCIFHENPPIFEGPFPNIFQRCKHPAVAVWTATGALFELSHHVLLEPEAAITASQ